MTLTRPSDFTVLPAAGAYSFEIQRKVGAKEEWEACVDNMMHLYAFLNRRTWFSWGWPEGLDETSTSYVQQFETTAYPAANRTTKTTSGSTVTYWVDHEAGDVLIEIYDDTGSTLLGSATHNATTRAQSSGTISVSNAAADDVLVYVSTKWDGVTGSEHTLYGVWVQETEMALADM